MVEQQIDRVLAIADRAVLLVKGAVAWEGPARDARPHLEARVLGGTSTNGAAAPASNGARPAPAPAASLGATAASATAGSTIRAGRWAGWGDSDADADADSESDSGAERAPGGPSDLWVTGPTFPGTN